MILQVLVLWDGEATFANELVPEALLHLQDPEPGVRWVAYFCIFIFDVFAMEFLF